MKPGRLTLSFVPSRSKSKNRGGWALENPVNRPAILHNTRFHI